jgi:anti-sigma B factor antagonist
MNVDILRLRTVAGVTIVGFVEADFDSEAKILAAADQIAALLEAGQARLLLDFGGVRYVGSAMLGRLLALNRRVAKAGGRLVLCGLSPYLRTIFEVGRLDRILTIRPDEDAALLLFGVESGGAGDGPAGPADSDPGTVDFSYDEDSP